MRMSKNNRFYEQNNNFARAPCVFVHYFLCLFVHDYDVNMPNFAFYGGSTGLEIIFG